MSININFSNLKWKWVGFSIVIFLLLQMIISLVFIIFGVLTLGIGFILFLILKPVAYFIAGFITGYVSPGVTITEPAIGALIISIFGLIIDMFSRHGHVNLFGLILTSGIAFVLALTGAYLGEKKQEDQV